MNLGLSASCLRCALAWGAATAVGAVLVTGLVPVLLEAAAAARAGSAGRARFDDVLVWGSATASTAATAWLWSAVTLVALDSVRGLPRPRRGVPEPVRRALLVLFGVALTTGLASPALATGGSPAGPEVLAGLRLPERVGVRPAVRLAARPAPLPSQAERREVVVSPGDTLWSLAAARLGTAARPAEIAAEWPRLYAANRDLIGPDPGLIEPGQRLVLPPATSEGGDRARD